MEEPIMSGNGTHWCHLCRQAVSPLLRPDDTDIKCPFCETGFLEEMGATQSAQVGSDSALSLWAPVLFGIMTDTNPLRRRQRNARSHGNDSEFEMYNDLNQEIESMLIRRQIRRGNSATILQMLPSLRVGLERNSENISNPSQNSTGDYFVGGPGLESLLQQLAENDPNRYGTPPAGKDAVEAMPTVKIQETYRYQCSVCLDDFEVDAEAREMPCKHKFHNDCILPWLELHSSCPVCRYQLPVGESKQDLDRSRVVDIQSGNMNGGDGSQAHTESNGGSEEGNGSQVREDGNASVDTGHVDDNSATGRRYAMPWPFRSLFSSSGSQNGSRNISSADANGDTPRDEN